MKKLKLIFTAAVIMLLSAVAVAQAPIAGGDLTATMTWELFADGTLSINGTGDMPTWENKDSQPWAAKRTDIKVVEMGEGVTSIAQDAFHACNNLQSISIPSTLTKIESWAFYECSNLTSITIPEGVSSIGINAFQGCTNLCEVYDLSTALTITKGSSDNGGVAQYAIVVYTDADAPSIADAEDGDYKFAYIGSNAYVTGYTGSGGDIAVPNSFTANGNTVYVKEISNGAFQNNRDLTSVILPDSLVAIESNAFAECWQLTSVTIGNSVQSIGEWAFAMCMSLSEITIPNSVQSIGMGAFEGCEQLTSVTIGNSAQSIGERAFRRCMSLSEITSPSTTPPDAWAAFDMVRECTLYVPNSAVEAYKAAEGWIQFGERIVGAGYSVVANANNNSYGITAGSGLYVENAEVTLAATPANSNCLFLHWADAAGDVVSIDNPYMFTATTDITLTAVFKKEKHDLTFDSDGGSTVAPQVVADGALAVYPVQPTKESYIFLGWNKGAAAYNFATPVTEDFTLTAQWTPRPYG